MTKTKVISIAKTPLSALSLLSLLIIAFIIPAHAANVSLAWDPNTPTPDGYRLYMRTDVGSYEEPVWSGAETTCQIEGLADNQTYYFVVRAFVGNEQSENSNEVMFVTNAAPNYGDTILDDEWSTNAGDLDGDGLDDSIDQATNSVTVAVPTGVSDPAAYYVEKRINRTLNGGSVYRIGFDHNVLSSLDKNLVSIFLQDNLSGRIISSEYNVFSEQTYARSYLDIVVAEYSADPSLFIILGQNPGSYYLTNITTEIIDTPQIEPIETIYVNRLERAGIGINYNAILKMPAPTNSEKIIVRTAKTLHDLLCGVYTNEAEITQVNPDGFFEHPVNVSSASGFLDGFFAEAVNVISGQESAPVYTAHLAGNNTGISDGPYRILYSLVIIDNTDVAITYTGYRNINVNIVPTPDLGPAGTLERADVDGVYNAGRSSDYSFTRSRIGKKLLIK